MHALMARLCLRLEQSAQADALGSLPRDMNDNPIVDQLLLKIVARDEREQLFEDFLVERLQLTVRHVRILQVVNLATSVPCEKVLGAKLTLLYEIEAGIASYRL